MSKDSEEDTRIFTRGLGLSIIPLGLLLLAFIIYLGFNPRMPDDSLYNIYPYEPSYSQLVLTMVTFILFGLAIALPTISIRREVQKKKASNYLPKEHGDY